MSLWEERAARNEALFREVNEQARSISGLQPPTGSDDLLIICECSDDRCTDRISLPRSVYETVRANSRHFLVVPGHEGDFEHIVERAGGYSIVEKEGQAGRIAEQNDPRP
jgi:hypothetical protein